MAQNIVCRRGLKIREPYIGYILGGLKTWEIRRQPTRIRERIALCSTKTKSLEDYANLINCFPMPLDELAKHSDRQHVTEDFLLRYARRKPTLYVWKLANITKVNPYPYLRSKAQIWGTL